MKVKLERLKLTESDEYRVNEMLDLSQYHLRS
jgi:hypothetical protein